jgi:hypothetical protein
MRVDVHSEKQKEGNRMKSDYCGEEGNEEGLLERDIW